MKLVSIERSLSLLSSRIWIKSFQMIKFDMAVFMGHVQAFSKYLIPTGIPNIASYFHLTRAIDRRIKLEMDVSFDFQVVWSHFILRLSRYSSFSEDYQVCQEKWTDPRPRLRRSQFIRWDCIVSHISSYVFIRGSRCVFHSFSVNHSFFHWVFW